MLSEKKYREFKIRINNAHVNIAGGITHELYELRMGERTAMNSAKDIWSRLIDLIRR